MTPTIINSIGLFLDIIGVALLFKFGMPSGAGHKSGGDYMMWGGAEPRLTKRWLRYRFWSRVGLSCLIAGFSLQIVSNWTYS